MPALVNAGPFSARNGEGVTLFEGVTIRLDEGELVVLDGPSGGGKSTLLRQLVALDPAEGASRSLDGEEFGSGELPRWRSRVTLVAQDAPMLTGTVRDNLCFPFAQRQAGDRHPDDRRLDELLAQVGLAGIVKDRDAATLSGGERHRLALVRGLLWAPPVLIADEPLSGLDEATANRCVDALLDFAHRPGHAVLGVLHEPRLAARADRVIRLGPADGGDGS